MFLMYYLEYQNHHYAFYCSNSMVQNRFKKTVHFILDIADFFKRMLLSYRALLKAGSSRPWPNILEEMTGSRKMDAQPLLDYFKPLENWLDSEIEEKNIPVGWDSTVDSFFPDPNPDDPSPAISFKPLSFLFSLTLSLLWM